eukprot:SAG11_NODE_11711_length_742_cov_2.244168_1_plen_97_part_00
MLAKFNKWAAWERKHNDDTTDRILRDRRDFRKNPRAWMQRLLKGESSATPEFTREAAKAFLAKETADPERAVPFRVLAGVERAPPPRLEFRRGSDL